MPIVDKEALVSYSPEQMFDLVDDIEHYPVFLPWCSDSKVERHSDQEVLGTLMLTWKGFDSQFVTKNTQVRPESIQLELIEGPLKYLRGKWEFIDLDGQGTQVKLHVEFESNHSLWDFAINKIFLSIVESLMDAFLEQADKRYQSKSVL